MRTAVLAVLTALLLIVPGARAPESASAEAALVFQTDMYGENVTPPVDSVAWGFVRFFFNEDRSQVSYTVDVKSLSNSLVAGADIHRGAPGTNGPVIHHLSDGNFIVTAGELSLTPAELQEMASGNWYVSLKTHANPDGELRGQVVVPANFLPNMPTPTASPAAPRPVTTPASGTAPPAPGTRPAGVITPPDTGDAGLVSAAEDVSGVALGVAAIVSLVVIDRARRLRASRL